MNKEEYDFDKFTSDSSDDYPKYADGIIEKEKSDKLYEASLKFAAGSVYLCRDQNILTHLAQYPWLRTPVDKGTYPKKNYELNGGFEDHIFCLS